MKTNTAKNHIYDGTAAGKHLIEVWAQAADQATIKYGIYVDAEYFVNQNNIIERIYFVVNEHEFDSLRDLEKALENKAFL